MSDRFDIPQKEVLNKMDSINIKNVDDVRQFYDITEMVAMPAFECNDEVHALSPRQYAVERNAILLAQLGRLEKSWWEIYSFVESSEGEFLSFLELQMLCMMLSAWLLAAGVSEFEI